MKVKNKIVKHLDFALLDIFVLIVSFLIGYYIRHSKLDILNHNLYIKIIIVVIVTNILVLCFFEPYKNVIKRGYFEELKSTFFMLLIYVLVSISYLFFIKESSNYSRATLLYSYIVYFLLSFVIKLIYKKYIINRLKSKKINNTKSLYIICKQKDFNTVKEQIINYEYNFYHIAGIYIINNRKKEKEDNLLITSSEKEFIKHISTKWIDEILVLVDYSSLSSKSKKAIEDSKIPVSIVIDIVKPFENRMERIQKFGEYRVVSIEPNERKEYQILIKRIFDIFSSIIGCILTVILIIVIGPIIYIKSPGNIFYVSDRVGKNGKVFRFYKFRSMVLNADNQKDELMKKNRLKDGMMFKIDDDPRIIPGIGDFIRKTSLDEFPQFFNVLKGDMSLVGTRPPTLDEWNKYSPYYRSRLSIKPGITGLWQVSGRSNITNFDEVVRLDNEYIDNFSLKFDLQILIKTFFVVFKKEGSM